MAGRVPATHALAVASAAVPPAGVGDWHTPGHDHMAPSKVTAFGMIRLARENGHDRRKAFDTNCTERQLADEFREAASRRRSINLSMMPSARRHEIRAEFFLQQARFPGSVATLATGRFLP